jgi:hypothetical protein
MEGYYKNIPIYRENRNKYVPKTKKWYLENINTFIKNIFSCDIY